MSRRYGISLGMGFSETLCQQVQLAAKAGFDACFTDWSPEKDGQVDSWGAAMADNGVLYQSIHAPFGGIQALWEDALKGEAYLDTLVRCLDACARNKVGIMVSHVCIGMDKHNPTLLGLKRFERLLDAAAERRVVVAFENTEGIEYLQAIMEAFGESPFCGFCWDTGHEQCYNGGQDMIARYGQKLVATHINDNLGMTDPQNMTWLDDLHLLPYDGRIDWNGVMARLDSIGYDGVYTAELTRVNKPGKHTHDRYADMGCGEFMGEALKRLQRITAESRSLNTKH